MKALAEETSRPLHQSTGISRERPEKSRTRRLVLPATPSPPLSLLLPPSPSRTTPHMLLSQSSRSSTAPSKEPTQRLPTGLTTKDAAVVGCREPSTTFRCTVSWPNLTTHTSVDNPTPTTPANTTQATSRWHNKPSHTVERSLPFSRHWRKFKLVPSMLASKPCATNSDFTSLEL